MANIWNGNTVGLPTFTHNFSDSVNGTISANPTYISGAGSCSVPPGKYTCGFRCTVDISSTVVADALFDSFSFYLWNVTNSSSIAGLAYNIIDGINFNANTYPYRFGIAFTSVASLSEQSSIGLAVEHNGNPGTSAAGFSVYTGHLWLQPIGAIISI